MTREQLPPMPAGIRHLHDDETQRLKKRFILSPHSVPSSPKNCVTCRGTKVFKWYSQIDRTQVVEYDCNCEEQWLMQRYFLYYGVPTSYQQLGWKDLGSGTDKYAIAEVWKYCETIRAKFDAGLGLFLYGDVGTGKTLLGTLVLKKFLAEGLTGVFSSFVDILEARSQGWRDQDDYDWFVQQVYNSEVLMIDDPGKEMKTSDKQVEFSTSSLDDVIRHRTHENHPTIITSNDDPISFARRYGRFVKSLTEESLIIVPVSGSSFRGDKLARNLRESDLGLRRPIVVE